MKNKRNIRLLQNMNILTTDKVVKQFEKHTALSGVSISIREGSIYGLLGPNGAGKTTLIRIINQITAPDEGTLTFKGERLGPKHISKIGYLPEERGLYKKMKVGEQALYLARLKGMKKNEAVKRLKYWFEKLEIQGWWNKKIEELSKGMQQKIQFVTTVIHQPELLIFDEPFSGFDPINANILKNEILEMKKNGSTIIFSTHNMSSVEEICDDIALINKSRKVLEGSVHEIKGKYKSHSFEIEYKGSFNKQAASLTADYKILEVIPKNGNQILRIQLNHNIESNKLLQNLMQFGEIIAFNELVPAMNDIFIKVVNETQNQTQEAS